MAPRRLVLPTTYLRNGPLGYWLALGLWAVLLAFGLSTEFLFQPFIWRGFSLDEILPVWLELLRDRMVVAAAIAVSLAVFGRGGRLPLGRRMILQAGAIVLGALVGELILRHAGDPDSLADPASFFGRMVRWTLIGASISTMLYVWQAGSDLAAEAENARIDEARLRRLAASSQLEMLRRQIEPHFLFNTLATIRRLQETDRPRSQHLLGRLFDYMSATLGDDAGAASTLADEVRLVRAYLEVCAARMTGPLTIDCAVPDDLCRIAFPPLVLATLAENAIKHGIPAERGGAIRIAAERQGETIMVTIADDGRGLGEKSSGSGIGLANIGERLRLLYGPGAGLRLGENTPSGVKATVLIPAASVS